MYYLYGAKRDRPWRLVASFDSEQQLKAYVRWATLAEENGYKFEQGSALAGCHDYKIATETGEEEDPSQVVHNPSPTML